MKPSRFNHFFPYENDENKVIAYNSYSNALALMEKAKHEMLNSFIDEGTDIDDKKFLEQLKHGSFLVDDDVCEHDRIRLRMLKNRFNTNVLNLTITPTADCNFRCLYCYEKDVVKPEYMTQEVEAAILEFTERHMNTISHLNISWYGGEPLMNLGTIERLSRKLIAMCDDNDVNYTSLMVTNGYLLTRESVELINELKISSLQISLDGDEETHNKRRPHVNGTGTFKNIFDNLVNSKDILPHVALRINLDKNNVESWRTITMMLEEYGLTGKVMPTLGKVTAYNDSYDKASCFDCGSFSKEELKYYNEFRSKDYYMSRYPKLKSNYCGADHVNSHIIGTDGRMYKCWLEVGQDEKCIGGLTGNVDAKEPVYLKYMLNDPTIDSKCSECNLLPVCMGGCPYEKLYTQDYNCSSYKYALDSYLNNISKRLKHQVGSETI